MMSEREMYRILKKCWAIGFPLKSGLAPPPLLDSATRVITTWETGGGLFTKLKLGELLLIYDFGVVVLNLAGLLAGGVYRVC